MNENTPPIVTLQLNLDQISAILNTVSKLPYEVVAPLVESIKMQTSTQLQQMQDAQNNGSL